MLVSARLHFLALLFLSSFSLLLAFPALAQWQMLEEVDVSGQPTYTLRAALSDKVFFQVWCRASERQIALLAYDGENAETWPNAEPVALRVQSDTGQVWQSAADYYRHAPGWLGTRYRNGLADARAIVEDIVAAKSSISVVLVQTSNGAEHPMSLGAKGSTAAGRAFIAKCFGSTPVAQPAIALSAWGVTVEPDPVNGGTQATLVGDLDQGGFFYAYCDGLRRPEVAFLSTNPATFPYEAGDVGLTLRIETDGDQRSAPGEHFARSDGKAGIRYYSEPEYVQGLIEAVGAATTEVAMTIESYTSGMVTRWPAKNLQGLAQAVAQFQSQCFGAVPAVADTPSAPAVATPDRVVAEWTLRSKPSDALPDHTLVVSTEDGKASVLLACDAAGQPFFGVEVKPGLIADTGPATDSVFVYIDDSDFAFIAESWSEGPLRYLQSTNVYQISDMVVRLANRAEDIRLNIVTTSGVVYTGQLPKGERAEATARDFARLCLAPDEYDRIANPLPSPVVGWELLDGEVAEALGALAVLRANAAPSGGRVEFRCFGEAGAHELAFYSDDFQKQDAIKAAFRLELAIFIGDDGYWPISEAGYAGSLSDLGIGTTDQAVVDDILDVLFEDAPAEMTISTRTDFDDYEPHKVPLANSFLVDLYRETCG